MGRFGSFLDPFRSDPLSCLDDFGSFFGSFLDPFRGAPLSCLDDFGCVLWSTKIDKHDYSGPVAGAFLGRFGRLLDPRNRFPLS